MLIAGRMLSKLSLVVKASDEVQRSRHYNKTLEELDRVSLVRERGFSGPAEDEGAEEEEEEAEIPEDEAEESEEAVLSREESRIRDGGGNKTDRQQALEAEWGLYRSPVVSQQSPEEEDGDTDDGRNHDSPDLDEEDFMVSCSSIHTVRS